MDPLIVSSPLSLSPVGDSLLGGAERDEPPCTPSPFSELFPVFDGASVDNETLNDALICGDLESEPNLSKQQSPVILPLPQVVTLPPPAIKFVQLRIPISAKVVGPDPQLQTVSLSNGQRLSCNQCAFCTDDRRLFRIHRRTHIGEKLFSCGDCAAKFTRSYYLKRHQVQKHGNLSVLFSTASNASATLVTRQKTKQHLRTCPYPNCQFETRNPTLWKLHKKTHAEKKPFYCKKCFTEYAHRKTLLKHIFNVHKDKGLALVGVTGDVMEEDMNNTGDESLVEKEEHNAPGVIALADKQQTENATIHNSSAWRCDRCDYVTASFKLYYTHRRTHQGDAPGSVNSCVYCWKKFPAPDKLVTHIKRQHIMNKSKQAKRQPAAVGKLRCELCDFETSSQRIFDTHSKAHKRLNEESRKTKATSRKSPRASSMSEDSAALALTSKNHSLINNPDEGDVSSQQRQQLNASRGQFSCRFCSFVTNIENSMEIHVSHEHERGEDGPVNAGPASSQHGGKKGFRNGGGKSPSKSPPHGACAAPHKMQNSSILGSEFSQNFASVEGASSNNGSPHSLGLALPPPPTAITLLPLFSATEGTIELENCVQSLHQANDSLMDLYKKRNAQLKDLRANVLQMMMVLLPNHSVFNIATPVSLESVDDMVRQVLAQFGMSQ